MSLNHSLGLFSQLKTKRIQLCVVHFVYGETKWWNLRIIVALNKYINWHVHYAQPDDEGFKGFTLYIQGAPITKYYSECIP